MRNVPLNAFIFALSALLATNISASAENGVSTDRIVFGQAAALEGPASALGQGMKMGLEAAFAEINKSGGVKGRKLELKSLDDGYEPTKSIEAVNKLLGEDKVFAIVGMVVLRHQPPLSRLRRRQEPPSLEPLQVPNSCASPTSPS